eukprot:g10326.t1
MNESPSCERSHWGLFDRVVKKVKTFDQQQQAVAYRSLTYHCGAKIVEFLQPLEGAGTRLMHGDFARKISPSEEALAFYILKHPRIFHQRKVLVVGAGLGLAGLVCATCTKAEQVVLTDGDPEVVKLLECSLELNKDTDTASLKVQQLLWERKDSWPERGSFDMVLGADVVYLEERNIKAYLAQPSNVQDLHAALLDMMARVLRPGGQVLLFASKRHGSLDKFIASSKSTFGSGEESEVVQRLCQHFAELHEEHQRQASEAVQRQRRQLLRRRARSESLLMRREQRLARQPEEEMPATPEPPPPPRVPFVPRAELEGRSDWGIFARSVEVISDDVKEMTYQCGKYEVRLRRRADSPRVTCGEEALAAWVLKTSRAMRRSRVLELGAGTGLAGLLAACISSKHSSGTFVIMASGAAMDTFLHEAAGVFPKIQVKREYDETVSKALHGMPCRPKLALLRRPAPAKRKVRQVVVEVPVEMDLQCEDPESEAQSQEDLKDGDDDGDEDKEDSSETVDVVDVRPTEKFSRSSSEFPGCEVGPGGQTGHTRQTGPSPCPGSPGYSLPGLQMRSASASQLTRHKAQKEGRTGMELKGALGLRGGALSRPLIRRAKSLPQQEGLQTLPPEI